MIGFLEGKIEFKGEKFAVINVGGVGYNVFFSSENLKKVPEKGEDVKIWTHEYVREDKIELYGFLTRAELEFFELLIGISGIGPRGALGVMSLAPVDTLKRAIGAGDTSYLTRVSGIGRKTAEKIVLELKDKMSGRGASIDAPELKDDADALDALISLGYSREEARRALLATPHGAEGIEKRVTAALKILGRKNNKPPRAYNR